MSRRRRMISVLAAVMACGTDPSAPVAPTGNFGGAFGDDQAYLALTLSEHDGSVVGTGWMSGGSSLGRFVLSGTYIGPSSRSDSRPTTMRTTSRIPTPVPSSWRARSSET
jgi:hypothetical protein